jgi:hypothetical protein
MCPENSEDIIFVTDDKSGAIPDLGQGFIVVTPEWLENLEKSGAAQAIRDAVAEQSDGTDELMGTLKDMGVELICTCATAPVQFEGELDGLHLYFRARGEHWDCAIAPTLDEAISEENLVYYKESDYGQHEFDASWMPHKEALELILSCIQEYKEALPK